MKNAIRKLLARRSLRDIARAELVEAQRSLMQAQAGVEHAQASVRQHQSSIARLTTALRNNTLIEIDDDLSPVVHGAVGVRSAGVWGEVL